MTFEKLIINNNDTVLVTGANGFIGSKVVKTLLEYGFRNVRCFVRNSGSLTALNKVINSFANSRVEIMKGNLLSTDDCKVAVDSVSLIYHLAAGMEKSFEGAYTNSVLTTQNLLDAAIKNNNLKRFLNVSSFTVYTNINLMPGELLDETCEIESQPELRGEAYCYAKIKQDELLLEYSKKYNVPYVIVRPGAVYGPGRREMTGRIGINKFGCFFHLGGSNTIPLSYVENCADAIVHAGLIEGVGGEIFNIVDDELPTSRQFLEMYKENVGHIKSIDIPRPLSFALCCLWEILSKCSIGKLPLIYNRKRWASDWKGNQYSNEKLKKLLGWKPRVSFNKAAKSYFQYCERGKI